MNREYILKSLNWRYATQKFDSTKKISDEDWNVLAESLRLCPSSYGIQPWKFIVVRNPEILKQLTAASWNQSQVENCSHFIVFATPKRMNAEHIHKYIQKMAEVRRIEPLSLQKFESSMHRDLVEKMDEKDSLSWMRRQAYIAMGFIMETAALLEIDTCAMEGISPAKYDEILGLKDKGLVTVAGLALGYRHKDCKYQNIKKVRFDINDVVEYMD